MLGAVMGTTPSRLYPSAVDKISIDVTDYVFLFRHWVKGPRPRLQAAGCRLPPNASGDGLSSVGAELAKHHLTAVFPRNGGGNDEVGRRLP